MITAPVIIDWLIAIFISFTSTVAFSIIFHTPKKQRVFGGITGLAGYFTYTVCLYFDIDVTIAAFFAAVVLTWLSRIFSFARKEPVTSFLICGIFPIVPGAGIYYTGYYLFMGNNALGLSKGFETIKIAIAIALGIGIILSLPRFFFTLKKQKALCPENKPEKEAAN